MEAGAAGAIFAVIKNAGILRLFSKFYLAQSEIDGMMSRTSMGKASDGDRSEAFFASAVFRSRFCRVSL